MALIVDSLDKGVHDRNTFDCGVPPLNAFLQSRAAKQQEQRVSRTFVLTEDATPGRILGYYTLSNGQIARETLSEKEAKALPRHPVPVVLLARLAVDRRQQKQHFGQWLLMDAIKRCALVGEQSGVYALVVDAKDEAAKSFYKRFGFVDITDRPMTLYLSLGTALQALQFTK